MRISKLSKAFVITAIISVASIVSAETILITTPDGTYEVEARKIQTSISKEETTNSTCIMPGIGQRIIVKEGYSLTSALRELNRNFASNCVIDQIAQDLSTKHPNININNVYVNFCTVRQKDGKFNKCSGTDRNGVLLK